MTAQRIDRPQLEPESRAAWSEWLDEHHADSRGVWLAVGKKGTTVTTLNYEDAVEEALRYGWIDSTVRRFDDDRFLQLFTPRKPKGAWAPSNKARVERLAAAGLMMPAGQAAVDVAKANGSWETLDDAEELTIPADLAVALADSPSATARFDELAPSARKMALYWISSAKRPETRARRIAETAAAASQGRPPR